MARKYNKLTKEIIVEVTKLLLNTDISHQELGEKFNVSTATIAKINNGDLLPEEEKYHRKMFDFYPVRKLGFTDEELEQITKVIPILQAAYNKAEKERIQKEKLEKKKKKQ